MAKAETTKSNETAGRLLAVIQGLAAELHPQQQAEFALTLDSRLDRDLGLDSLGRVELLSRIEQTFDTSISEQLLASAETPRDLLRAILAAGSGRQAIAPAATEVTGPAAAGPGTLPLQATTLIEVLEWHLAAHPDRPHIRLSSDLAADDEVISFRQLWEGSAGVAAGLGQAGLNCGESVIIMLPTGREYFFSFLGVLLAGGVPVPTYPPGRPKQIGEHLQRHAAIAANSQARIMITVPAAKRFAQIMKGQAADLHSVVTVDDLLASAAKLPAAACCPPPAGPDHTAFLQYTSGSTGAPKGVVLSHANLLANIRAMARAVKADANDVFVSWLPLYHDMGLIGAWLGSFYLGCQLVIMPPLNFIARPARWLLAIHRYRGTLSAAPNFAYELCLKKIKDRDIEGIDLSSWRCAFNGAEAVNAGTMQRFTERFAEFGFRAAALMPVYGLAESSVGLCLPPLERGLLIDPVNRQEMMTNGRALAATAAGAEVLRLVSCGQPLPGHQVRIVDTAGRELPDRHEGRLQFQGPSSTSGYFRRPDETARLFDGRWLNSGDRAYIAGGDIFITGRAKDIIIRAGRNIYPEEIEDAVGNLDGIIRGNVAAFGIVDHDSGTERLVLVAETRKRDPRLLAGLRSRINNIVIDLIDSPPDEVILAPPNTVLKTSSGKIRRAASREIYERGDLGRPQPAVWFQIARYVFGGAGQRLRRLAQKTTAAFYAAYCWLLLIVAGAATWLLVAILPVKSWRWAVTRAAARFFARSVNLSLRINGIENLLPPHSRCVFVANHASYLDGLVLAAALPLNLSFIAKDELRQNFISRIFLKRLDAEFVERFDMIKGINDARRLAARAGTGQSLFFFAEGTFMRMPGLLPFRLGAFETAVAAGLPLVPIAIRGTRSILRAGSWFPRRGSISLAIGRPINADSTADNWQAAVDLRASARQWILRHCGEPDLEHERPPLLNSSSPADKKSQ